MFGNHHCLWPMNTVHPSYYQESVYTVVLQPNLFLNREASGPVPHLKQFWSWMWLSLVQRELLPLTSGKVVAALMGLLGSVTTKSFTYLTGLLRYVPPQSSELAKISWGGFNVAQVEQGLHQSVEAGACHVPCSFSKDSTRVLYGTFAPIITPCVNPRGALGCL